jgi:hypothetical protein
MKVKVTIEFVNMANEPIWNVPTQQGNPPTIMTLRDACVTALLGVYQDEPNLLGTEKLTRYELAKVINSTDEPDLRVEELTLCKELIAKVYGPIVVGQAWPLLDPPATVN